MLSQQGNDTLSPSKKLDFQIIEVTPIGEDAVMVTYSIATGNSYKQLRVNKINGDWKVTLQSDRNQIKILSISLSPFSLVIFRSRIRTKCLYFTVPAAVSTISRVTMLTVPPCACISEVYSRRSCRRRSTEVGTSRRGIKSTI